MSIIIRLQNLPLAANSMDIRRYFGGLVIPPAGVHIIGGEKGDAFIAFATDEDARQAMERDNGKIKDARIKLLLSSRNEMQRIIEIARNQTLVAQGFLPSSTPSGSVSKSNRRSSISPEKRRSRSPDRRRDRDRDRSSRKSSSRRRSRSKSPKRRDRDSGRRRDRSPEKPKDSKNDSPEILSLPKDDNSRSSIDNGEAKQASESEIILNQATPVVTSEESILSQPTDPCLTQNSDLQLSQTSISLSQPMIPNFGFNPLFPIISPEMVQPNINMMDPNFGNRLGFEGLPFPKPSDSYDKRDPPVWQNPTSLPFNLIPMNQSGSVGNLGVNLVMDRGITGQNNNNRMDIDRSNNLTNLRDDNLDTPQRRMMSNNAAIFDMDRGFSRRNGGRDMNQSGPLPPRSSDRERDRGRDSRLRGYCIEMRNLPFAITYREIRDFLRGCNMPQESLALVEINGRRTGVGYALLCGERDVQEALRKHRSLILNRRIEIARCDEDEFIDAYKTCGNRNRKPYKKSGEDLVIALKGLPFSSTEKDVVGFLGGLDVADVVVEYDHLGKTVGNAFVRFAHYDDFKIALTFDGKQLLHRYIEILPSTIETMYEASKYSPAPVNRPAFPKTGPMADDVMNKIKLNSSSFAVSLRGLPPNITDKDIAQFFGAVNIVPQAIHIMVNPNGLPSGDAFAEFPTAIDFEKALKQDSEFIGGRLVRINPISLERMHEILGRPVLPARMLNDGRPMMGPDGPGHSRSMDHPDFEMLDEMEKRRYMDEMEMINGPRFPGGGPGFHGPPRGPMGPPFNMMGPRFPQRPMMRNPVPDNFGKPGCVVSARNLSFKAKDIDILDLFHSYNIDSSNIIRRFDNQGNVTGEARIDFNTPDDASRAISEIGGKMFMGRNIILSKP